MMRVKPGVVCGVLFFVGMMWLGITAVCSGAERVQSPAMASLLRQVPVFQRLDEAQLEKIAGAAEMATQEAGDRIIEQGKRAGRMAVALDSEVDIRIDGERLRVLPAKMLVGEMEFLEDCPASADVVMVGKSRVIFLENGRFRALMDADPILGYRMMNEIARLEANRLRTNPVRQTK